jgi:hypothetical protein
VFLPEQGLSLWTSADLPADTLVLEVFPGAAGRFRLYEDDGATPAYEQGQCEWTEITARMARENAWVVQIAPAAGHCAVLPPERAWEVRLRGCREPSHVVVNNVDIADWDYDPAKRTVTVRTPRRDRRQPVTVTALAEGCLVALGAAYNEHLALADARRLLGVEAGDAAELLEIALQGDTDAHRTAVARLGGPFARFIEFTTPEEAAQQLGRLIVGAPAGGEPYDVAVAWTLHRAGGTILLPGDAPRAMKMVNESGTSPTSTLVEVETRTDRVAATTTPQILDCPFSWDGRIETAYWEATVHLTWRGHTLAETHRSQVLFPPVQEWRVMVYSEANPVSLEQVLAGEAGLAWMERSPDATALVNLNRPFLLRLGAEHRVRLQAGERLAAYLATTVESPEDQEATLLVRTRTPVEVYVNGEPVKLGPQEEELSFYPFEARRTAPVRLQAGENALLVRSHADLEGEAAWYVAGILCASPLSVRSPLHP